MRGDGSLVLERIDAFNNRRLHPRRRRDWQADHRASGNWFHGDVIVIIDRICLLRLLLLLDRLRLLLLLDRRRLLLVDAKNFSGTNRMARMQTGWRLRRCSTVATCREALREVVRALHDDCPTPKLGRCSRRRAVSSFNPSNQTHITRSITGQTTTLSSDTRKDTTHTSMFYTFDLSAPHKSINHPIRD